jgi:type II secretory pathway pseudopilin PulG
MSRFSMIPPCSPRAGFSLIQISILLTVVSLALVTVLPSMQSRLKADATTVASMSQIWQVLRAYQVANGNLPCPADPTQGIDSPNYGVAATNSGASGNCVGGSLNAAYADSTQHIAIGMLPVKTLQLPTAAALDAYGRDITYAVDTTATGCWATPSLPGAITVNDNGVAHTTVAALVSHGQDGYGAWLPLQGAGNTAVRFDTGSTDTAQADNAQVRHCSGQA